MESALFVGSVRHRRFTPRRHRFAYPLFMLYADLGELDRIFTGSFLASTRRPALLRLRRADHFGATHIPWEDAVRDAVAERLGRRPAGPVRLLTHPRTLGFRMNPISLFFLFDSAGALDAVLAEVTNTPWDERHLYALDARERRGRAIVATSPKALHVSPFMPMDLDYHWRLTEPGQRLALHLETHRQGVRLFDATLRLERRSLDPANLRRALLAHPAMTMKVRLWIYLHAARLWAKRVPFHPHPGPSAPPSR